MVILETAQRRAVEVLSAGIFEWEGAQKWAQPND